MTCVIVIYYENITFLIKGINIFILFNSSDYYIQRIYRIAYIYKILHSNDIRKPTLPTFNE